MAHVCQLLNQNCPSGGCICSKFGKIITQLSFFTSCQLNKKNKCKGEHSVVLTFFPYADIAGGTDGRGGNSFTLKLIGILLVVVLVALLIILVLFCRRRHEKSAPITKRKALLWLDISYGILSHIHSSSANFKFGSKIKFYLMIGSFTTG